MTDPVQRFAAQFSKCSIIAILRGLASSEAEWVGDTLYESGIRIIEVPLNSPLPYKSIELMKRRLPDDAILGAGTVTSVEQVEAVANAGGELIVSPNTDTDVIETSVARGLISAPGCLTPSEAFTAIKSGAHALKIFPASVIGPSGIKAIGATLPAGITVIAVGGVGPDNMNEYKAVGVDGFGLGSSLFIPGITQSDLSARAKASVQAATRAFGAAA